MMTFNLGKKVFIDNLTNDVTDVEKALRNLTALCGCIENVRNCKSWKYPGSSVFDVDIENVLNCFRYNAHSQEESKKANLVLTELTIDRLVALLQISIIALENCLVQSPLTQNISFRLTSGVQRTSLSVVVENYIGKLMMFLAVWGIVTGPEENQNHSTCRETQTEFIFKPHDPCEACGFFKSSRDKLRKSVSKTFSLKCDPESPNASSQIQKVYNSFSTGHRMSVENCEQAKATLSEMNRLFFDAERKSLEMSDSEERLKAEAAIISKRIIDQESNVVASKQKVSERERLIAETDQYIEELNQELYAYGNAFRELQDQFKTLESKIFARKTVEHLSYMSAQEERAKQLGALDALTDQIQEFEAVYDPAWQETLAAAAEKVTSLTELWSDSQLLALQTRAELDQLDNNLINERRENQNLYFELRKLEGCIHR